MRNSPNFKKKLTGLAIFQKTWKNQVWAKSTPTTTKVKLVANVVSCYNGKVWSKSLFWRWNQEMSGYTHTWQCLQRPRTSPSLGTWLRICHTTLARVERRASNCAEASWERDWDKNNTVVKCRRKSEAILHWNYFCFSYWCSIWKLRCPLNQSLKEDCSTLHVATS